MRVDDAEVLILSAWIYHRAAVRVNADPEAGLAEAAAAAGVLALDLPNLLILARAGADAMFKKELPW